MDKGYQTLIRLHQYHVDEKRRALGNLLGQVANLENQSSELENQILVEQDVARSAPENVGMFYGDYAAAVVQKLSDLTQAITKVESHITVAQDEMRTEYKDLKVYEISQETIDTAEKKERDRQETAFLDELGQEAYRRKG